MKTVNTTIDDNGKVDVKFTGIITVREFQHAVRALRVGYRQYNRQIRIEMNKANKSENKLKNVKETKNG